MDDSGKIALPKSVGSPEVIAMATPVFTHVLVTPIDIGGCAFRAL
jgi:hypothetical protein